MRRRHTFATVLVGKNNLRREGLERILRSAHFRILASVSCADDLADDLASCKVQPCRVLFLIVHAGADLDAVVGYIELLKDRHPEGRIAIVADHYRLDELVLVLRAGANGFFVDVMTCDAFIKSLELVMMGETVFPPAFLEFVLGSEKETIPEVGPRGENDQATLVSAEEIIAPQLSPREKSILRCLIEGDSNKCIARKIDIAEATVKVHVKAILRKIRVQNRTQAAIWAMNNRSLARSSGNKLPQLSSDADERSTNLPAKINDINRVEPKVLLGAFNEANQVCRADHLTGKRTEAAGAIRLRK
jgi:DNA-binding NarL/FixJ family response regulator